MWRQYKGLIILGVIVGAGYGGHLLYRYVKVEQDVAPSRPDAQPSRIRAAGPEK